MLQLILSLVFTLLLGVANAEDWLCKNESSQLVDGALQACGIGEGKDENEARAKAFENARAEFIRVCDASDTCKGRLVSVEPKRTTCEMQAKGNRCYRMVVFNVGSELVNDVAAKKAKDGTASVQRIEVHDKREVFAPFVYESIADLPKVKAGMTKAELLSQFGAPIDVSKGFDGKDSWMFKGPMCMFDYCNVFVRNGRVTDYSKFKPVYTEDLK